VGLDIEPGYIAAVEARPKSVAVQRAAGMHLAPGIVREGEVVDVAMLAAALKGLFAEHKFPRRVRLGLANQRIVVRTLDLPPLSDPKELASAVRFQAQEHIPMPLEQAVLEHHSLGIVDTPNGPRNRVVLVAARRDMVERLLEAVKQAGLRAQGVDLSAYAMIRALHRPGGTLPTLYVSVAGMTNLAVAVGTTCVFTRVVPLGAEAMAQELAERRGLTLEHSNGWLKHVGLTTPESEIDGDPEIVAESRLVLGDGVRRIGDELRNSLDFYTMQEGSEPVDHAVLSGPVVSIPGFCERLSEYLQLPVEIRTPEEESPGAFGDVDPGRLTIAAGLTIEEAAA
jgi:type IV pilus assembly protein PilM